MTTDSFNPSELAAIPLSDVRGRRHPHSPLPVVATTTLSAGEREALIARARRAFVELDCYDDPKWAVSQSRAQLAALLEERAAKFAVALDQADLVRLFRDQSQPLILCYAEDGREFQIEGWREGYREIDVIGDLKVTIKKLPGRFWKDKAASIRLMGDIQATIEGGDPQLWGRTRAEIGAYGSASLFDDSYAVLDGPETAAEAHDRATIEYRQAQSARAAEKATVRIDLARAKSGLIILNDQARLIDLRDDSVLATAVELAQAGNHTGNARWLNGRSDLLIATNDH
jgi:hypothetical protein